MNPHLNPALQKRGLRELQRCAYSHPAYYFPDATSTSAVTPNRERHIVRFKRIMGNDSNYIIIIFCSDIFHRCILIQRRRRHYRNLVIEEENVELTSYKTLLARNIFAITALLFSGQHLKEPFTPHIFTPHIP